MGVKILNNDPHRGKTEYMDISELVLAAQSTLKNMKADTANMSVSNETILKNAKLLNMISKSMIEWAEKK